MPPFDAASSPPDDPQFAAGTPLGPDLLGALPADVAFAVWQVLRTLALWTAEPERRRAEMFDAAYMEAWEHALLTGPLEPEVRFPLAVVVGELAASPAGEGRLSWACVCVADWALGRGAVSAGLAFAEAAALASPLQPRYAWLAGRLLRAHGDALAAERWLHRAHRLAVSQRDWETQARALTALGNLYLQRGRYPDARAWHGRALRVSRRWRLYEQEGMALHDLFAIAQRDNQRTDAERFAREALEAYRRSPPRIPRLAHDLAYWWMTLGHFSRAFRVFQAVLPHFPAPDPQLRIISNMAHAAAGLGERAQYLSYLADARRIMQRLETGETRSAALLELAYGAVALGDESHALVLLQESLQAATARGEADVVLAAEALTTALQRPDPASVHTVWDPRRPAGGAGEQLADDLVELLADARSEAA